MPKIGIIFDAASLVLFGLIFFASTTIIPFVFTIFSIVFQPAIKPMPYDDRPAGFHKVFHPEVTDFLFIFEVLGQLWADSESVWTPLWAWEPLET